MEGATTVPRICEAICLLAQSTSDVCRQPIDAKAAHELENTKKALNMAQTWLLEQVDNGTGVAFAIEIYEHIKRVNALVAVIDLNLLRYSVSQSGKSHP